MDFSDNKTGINEGDAEFYKKLLGAESPIICQGSQGTFYEQGWVCPKCGGVYSPTQSCCPHCTPPVKLDVTYVTGTGDYNPNINQSISIIDTGSTKVNSNIAQADPNSNIKVTG